MPSEEVSEADLDVIQQFAESVKDKFDSPFVVELKSKKASDQCLFTLGRTKLYFIKIAKGKAISLLDCSLPNLNAITSASSESVSLDTKNHGKLDLTTSKANSLIHSLRTKIFSEVYPGMNEKDNSGIVVKVPEDRLEDLMKIDRPCGNFKLAYLAECEANNVPVREDIVYDVETLLGSNHITEFNLEEFEGTLTPNDIKTLLGALRFNPYFTSLKLRGMKLEKDQVAVLLNCLKSNRAIESLSFTALQVSKEFFVDLFKELQTNKNCAVREINLADNKDLGDTGIAQLSTWIASIQYGISTLELSNCGIKGKGFASLFTSFKKNVNISTTLTRLDLSLNRLEGDGSSALSAFLANPNAISQLLIRDCGANLELILGALHRGSCREMRELDMSLNKFTAKNSTLSLFVKSSSTVNKINVSGTGFSAEMFKELLTSIKGNHYLSQVELNVSKNNLGHAGARIIMDEGADLLNITSLDLSENDFEDESMIQVCHGLSRCTCIKRLDLSRNMPSKPGRGRDPAIEGLITLVTSLESSLEHLKFCGGKGMQLGADLVRIIDGMGESVLLSLDISGHAIGNSGAASLGKMLQFNNTLNSLVWDENGTTLMGFKNFRKGLKRNATLKSMSLPIMDIEAALSKESDKPALLKIIRDLESCIVNNNSPKSKFKAKDQVAGNEFLFYSTPQREALEQQIIKLKSKGKKPSDDDQVAIKDAENFETIVAELHIAKSDALQSFDAALKTKLQSLAATLEPLITEQTISYQQKMMKIIEEGYPSLDSDTVRLIGRNVGYGTQMVGMKELEEVMVSAAGADIGLKMAECFDAAVDIAADYCFEKLEHNLKDITDRLEHEVIEAKNKKEKKEKKHKKDKSKADDDGIADTKYKPSSSSSLVTSSSSSSTTKKDKDKKDKEPKDDKLHKEAKHAAKTVPVEVEESDEAEEPETEVATPEEDEEEETGDVEDAGEGENEASNTSTPVLASTPVPAFSPPSIPATHTDEDTDEEAAMPPTPAIGSEPARTSSSPNIAAVPPSIGVATTGGSSGTISTAPKKAPPAIPKTGPPPTPKFKLPPGSTPASGNAVTSPTAAAPGEAKTAPKGPPPKVPPNMPASLSSGPASGTPKVVGKLAATQMQMQIKLGPPPGGFAGGAAPPMPTGAAPVATGGGPPPMPSVGKQSPAKPGGAAPMPGAGPKLPASSPSKPKDDRPKDDRPKDDKPKEDKSKKDAPKDKKDKAPKSAKMTKKPGKDEDGQLIAPVSSEGAAAGLSAGSTEVAPEGALDDLAKQTAAPVVDPRANRAGGAARRRPPTRRPQAPTTAV